MKFNNKTMAIAIVFLVILIGFLSVVLIKIPSKDTAVSENTGETEDLPEEGTATPEPVVIPDNWRKVTISELMYDNKATIKDENGLFSDWVELYNGSDESISLDGWILNDGENSLPLDGITLEAHTYRTVFCTVSGSTGFGISESETVSLCFPGGELSDSIEALSARADASIVHSNQDGATEICLKPTPGFPNDNDGFIAYQESLAMPKGLVINEVCTANTSSNCKSNYKYYDWVELYNNSDETLQLSDYYLSDKAGETLKWQFPEAEIAPHAYISVLCMGDDEPGTLARGVYAADFSLSASGEQVYLSTQTEAAIDYVGVYDIRADMSYGRSSGGAGWLIYTEPTPNEENKTEGLYFICDKPQVSVASGVYDDVDEFTVELSADGDIYYTLNGDNPTENSEQLYTEPITITSTSVLRAFTAKDGYISSDVMYATYIVNEHLTLPVIAVSSDVQREFSSIFANGTKWTTIEGNFTYFVDGQVAFSSDCGIYMKGYTSLTENYPKHNFGVSFKGIYDSEDFEYDIFGTGITSYSKLSVRAGQDTYLGIIRNELSQDLCLACSDSVITQHSIYCILFVNGRYYGIYTLKDDVCRELAAHFFGVDKDEVDIVKSPVSSSASEAAAEFNTDIFDNIENNDTTDPEWYASFCEKIDIDSLIDWVIIEGYTANTDVNGNLKYARADNGKWYFILYDMDWTFKDADWSFHEFFNYSTSVYWAPYLIKLCKNDEFRDRLLTRYAELLSGPLSDESVTSRINEMCAELEPEVERDRTRWGGFYSSWQKELNIINQFVTGGEGHARHSVVLLCKLLEVSNEERMEYFGF